MRMEAGARLMTMNLPEFADSGKGLSLQESPQISQFLVKKGVNVPEAKVALSNEASKGKLLAELYNATTAGADKGTINGMVKTLNLQYKMSIPTTWWLNIGETTEDALPLIKQQFLDSQTRYKSLFQSYIDDMPLTKGR